MKLSREQRQQRRKLHEEMNRTLPSLVEKDEETIKKFLSKQPYEGEDITRCVKELFKDSRVDFKKQFKFLEDLEEFDEIFEKIDKALTRPYFFVFSKREYQYVLFCLIKDKNRKIKILYKDPFSNVVDRELEAKIRSKFDNVDFIVHIQVQENEDVDSLYGAMCLRNVKIMLDCFQMDAKNFVDIFKYLEFCTKSDINRDRLSRVMVLTHRISKNEGFLQRLREFINRLPSELTSDEENDADELESNIQEDYPAEMEDVHILLQIIADTVSGMQILTILKNICDILGLNYSKIQSLFHRNKAGSGFDKNKDLNVSKMDDGICTSLDTSSLKVSSEQSDYDNQLSYEEGLSKKVDGEFKNNIEGDNIMSPLYVEEKMNE